MVRESVLSPDVRRSFDALDAAGMEPEVGSYGEVRSMCLVCWSPPLDEAELVPTYEKTLTINGTDPNALSCRNGCESGEIRARLEAHAAAQAAGSPTTSALSATPLSRVRARPVVWLWDKRIPLGAITLLAGPEGVGKSTFLAWLAAQVTGGVLPGAENGRPGAVLIAALEDDAETTLKPRMMAAGADLDAVAVIDDSLVLPAQVDAVAGLIRAGVGGLPVRLLIIDPIKATTAGIDTDRERGVRDLLGQLVTLAHDNGITILLSTHFKKGAGAEDFAAWKVSGSPAWTQVPRSVLFLGTDPDEDEAGPDRIIAHAKTNMGKLAPTLNATITTSYVLGDDGEQIETSVLALGGESAVRASEMSRQREPSTKVDVCAAWLASYLGTGVRHDSGSVKAAAEAAGFHDSTVSRARKKAGVVVEREGSGADHRSAWFIPRPDVSDASDASQPPPEGTPVTPVTEPDAWCGCREPLPAPNDGDIRCVRCGLTTTWGAAA